MRRGKKGKELFITLLVVLKQLYIIIVDLGKLGFFLSVIPHDEQTAISNYFIIISNASKGFHKSFTEKHPSSVALPKPYSLQVTKLQ